MQEGQLSDGSARPRQAQPPSLQIPAGGGYRPNAEALTYPSSVLSPVAEASSRGDPYAQGGHSYFTEPSSYGGIPSRDASESPVPQPGTLELSFPRRPPYPSISPMSQLGTSPSPHPPSLSPSPISQLLSASPALGQQGALFTDSPAASSSGPLGPGQAGTIAHGRRSGLPAQPPQGTGPSPPPQAPYMTTSQDLRSLTSQADLGGPVQWPNQMPPQRGPPPGSWKDRRWQSHQEQPLPPQQAGFQPPPPPQQAPQPRPQQRLLRASLPAPEQQYPTVLAAPGQHPAQQQSPPPQQNPLAQQEPLAQPDAPLQYSPAVQHGNPLRRSVPPPQQVPPVVHRGNLLAGQQPPVSRLSLGGGPRVRPAPPALALPSPTTAAPSPLPMHASPTQMQNNVSPPRIAIHASPTQMPIHASPTQMPIHASSAQMPIHASSTQNNISPPRIANHPSPTNNFSPTRIVNSVSPTPIVNNVTPTHMANNASPTHMPNYASPTHMLNNASPTHIVDNVRPTAIVNNASPTHMPNNASPTHTVNNVSPTGMLNNDSPADIPNNASPTHMPNNTTVAMNGFHDSTSGISGANGAATVNEIAAMAANGVDSTGTLDAPKGTDGLPSSLIPALVALARMGIAEEVAAEAEKLAEHHAAQLKDGLLRILTKVRDNAPAAALPPDDKATAASAAEQQSQPSQRHLAAEEVLGFELGETLSSPEPAPAPEPAEGPGAPKLGQQSSSAAPSIARLLANGNHSHSNGDGPSHSPTSKPAPSDNGGSKASTPRGAGGPEEPSEETDANGEKAVTDADLVPQSLGLFAIDSRPRQLALRIIRNRWFDRTITFLIVANCVFLAIDDPTDPPDPDNMTAKQQATFIAEYIFLVLFTLEMIVKVVALGFVRGKNTYLRNPWNWLDFVVVCIGYLSFVGVDNLSALRTFRVLRPLRTLTTIPSMKVIVVSMLASIPELSGVALLTFFMLSIWAIAGVQLWGLGSPGVLEGRCFYPPTRAFDVPLLDCTYPLSQANATGGPCYDPVPTACSYLTEEDGSYVYEQVNFTLSRATGEVEYPQGGIEGCSREEAVFLPCGSARCGWNDDRTRRVVPSSDKSGWRAAGELVVNADLWPLPRFPSDWKREYTLHGVNVTATINSLLFARDGTEDAFGTEEGKEVVLQLYENVSVTGGWDPDAFCGLPGENGAACAPSSNGSVTVQGECRRWESPQFGNGGFNNIGVAILTVYTSVTLEGWADNLYALNATWGNGWFNVWYFVLLVAFGGFFVMELAMAVIWDRFTGATATRLDGMDMTGQKGPRTEQQSSAGEEAGEGEADEAGEGEQTQEVKYWMDTASVRFMHRLVTSKPFDALITVFIVLNTISLAVEHYGQGPAFVDALTIMNYVFSAVFLLEMLAKLWGLGAREYARDKFNLFDGIIVTFSIIEIGFDVAARVQGEEGSSTGLSALRTFRLMRVFKLARSWKDLQVLLATIMRSMLQVANAALLLGVIMFIFTLLGMQLFGGKMKWYYYGTEPEPRAHFDSFWWAFVSVFQVLTGENWNDILYNTIWALGQPEEASSPFIAILYFIVLNIVGNYMIMNLFLAILLSNFSGADQQAEQDELDASPADQQQKEGVAGGSEPGGTEPPSEGAPTEGSPASTGTAKYNAAAKSLMLFPGDSKFRMGCFKVMTHPRFDNVVLLLIAVSSILLAVDEPYVAECKHPGGSCRALGQTLLYLDWIISVLFGLEMLVKVVAVGLWQHEGAYLRDPWNVLDFVIVQISFLSLCLGGGGAMKALRALRALRALKPLRVVRRYPALRLVVNAIFRALPRVLNVSLVAMLFFVIFAIVGVQNFGGSMKHCNDGAVVTKEECKGTFELGREECGFMPTDERAAACVRGEDVEFPRVWEDVSPWNFDHLGRALLVLYEVASGEMWPDIMYDTINAAGVDEPMREVDAVWPEGTNYVTVSLYYIAVTVVLAFLMLNVFVGVVIDEYGQMKGEEDGSGLMTPKQKEWYQSMKYIAAMSPQVIMIEPPAWRKPVFRVVTSRPFEVSILVLIMLNTLVMAIRHYPESEAFETAMLVINPVFTGLFALEAIAKTIGLGYKQYFSVYWNRFDFVVVVSSIVGSIVDVFTVQPSLFRVLRVGRVVRLVRWTREMLVLLGTFVYAMPSIINVGVVLLLLYFVMAVIAMNIFSGVKYGELLNEDANFDSFDKSFETLFRCSTGESFNGIMYDLMIEEPYCDPDTNCGSVFIPPIFFTFFFTVQAYIFLNLIVAIILDVFGDINGLSNSLVTEEHLDSFKAVWSHYDTNSNKWIDARHAKAIVMQTDYPLGLKGINDSREFADDPLTEEQIEQMAEERLTEYNLKAIRHNAEDADRHDVVRAGSDGSLAPSATSLPDVVFLDGYVYEISFQDTLQAMADRVSRVHGGRTDALPVKIRSALTGDLQKAKSKQMTRKLKQSLIGDPVNVHELEEVVPKRRFKAAGLAVLGAQRLAGQASGLAALTGKLKGKEDKPPLPSQEDSTRKMILSLDFPERSLGMEDEK